MTSKACKRSRHDSLTIAVPFVVLAVMASNWQVSLLFWMVALCMSGTFLAPAVAVVQAYAPTRLATVFALIYLLANNLVRAGQGLLYVATVSDKAERAWRGRIELWHACDSTRDRGRRVRADVMPAPFLATLWKIQGHDFVSFLLERAPHKALERRMRLT